MDEILLYLSLKYFGEWMAIYDSLQKKEQLKVYDIKRAVNSVDAEWITLISSYYPKNLKAIYKPPFGIYCYGKSKLLHQNIVTIMGDINDNNKHALEFMHQNYINFLWPKKSNKEIATIINTFTTNNIFFFNEMKNEENKAFQNMLGNEDIILENAFCSEIWEKNQNVDYSNQWQERIYLGLSLQVLIISSIKNKELLALAEYCEKENIKIGILKSACQPNVLKVLKNNKVSIVEKNDQLLEIFNEKK